MSPRSHTDARTHALKFFKNTRTHALSPFAPTLGLPWPPACPQSSTPTKVRYTAQLLGQENRVRARASVCPPIEGVHSGAFTDGIAAAEPSGAPSLEMGASAPGSPSRSPSGESIVLGGRAPRCW
jgi:hypothetical protein